MENSIIELKECVQKNNKQEFLRLLYNILGEIYNNYKDDSEKNLILNRTFNSIEKLVEIDDIVAVLDLVEYELLVNFK